MSTLRDIITEEIILKFLHNIIERDPGNYIPEERYCPSILNCLHDSIDVLREIFDYLACSFVSLIQIVLPKMYDNIVSCDMSNDKDCNLYLNIHFNNNTSSRIELGDNFDYSVNNYLIEKSLDVDGYEFMKFITDEFYITFIDIYVREFEESCNAISNRDFIVGYARDSVGYKLDAIGYVNFNNKKYSSYVNFHEFVIDHMKSFIITPKKPHVKSARF